MLFEAAARLALVEALRPTASITANGPWPTVAAGRVYDSRRVSLDDIDGEFSGVVISIYTGEAISERRADLAAADDRDARVVLQLIVEMPVLWGDDQSGAQFADAKAADDPAAELTLAGCVAQIRRTIETGPTGSV